VLDGVIPHGGQKNSLCVTTEVTSSAVFTHTHDNTHIHCCHIDCTSSWVTAQWFTSDVPIERHLGDSSQFAVNKSDV